jgi:N-formylmaleamate deformylase
VTTLDPDLQADLDATGAQSRFADAPHGRLHALDHGGDGVDVLVLPGITSPAVTWDFVARELVADGRIVVADLRGRGLSIPPADGDYTLEAYADDAAALIEGLGLERPVVLGHSLGARIAAALDVRHPGLAGSLLLVDPPLSGPGRDPYPISAQAFLAQLREAQAGTTAEEVGRYWPGWPHAELALRARWLPTCDETAVLETQRNFEAEDFLPWWEQMGAAAVLVRGGRSPVVTEAGAAELAAARPDVPQVVIPDTGHMIPWDDLDGFVAATRDFLRRTAVTP